MYLWGIALPFHRTRHWPGTLNVSRLVPACALAPECHPTVRPLTHPKTPVGLPRSKGENKTWRDFAARICIFGQEKTDRTRCTAYIGARQDNSFAPVLLYQWTLLQPRPRLLRAALCLCASDPSKEQQRDLTPKLLASFDKRVRYQAGPRRRVAAV